MMQHSHVRHVFSGEEYVRQITRSEADRRTREAFRRLALDIATPGTAMFDFGSGPGIDARFFAERGFTVGAYDICESMREYFLAHCRDFIGAGRISLEPGDYREFLARAKSNPCRVDLVVSNFAPLCLVPDLPELFAALHALTRPGAQVLASVLNPYFLRDLPHLWWLRRVPRLIREGHYSLPSPEGPVSRRRLADFARRAHPYFSLVRVYRGLPAAGSARPLGHAVSGLNASAIVGLTPSRFLFLRFQRCD